MDFLLDALTKWLKEMLVGGIMSNLSGLFDSVNKQVADISVQVGQTPQGWNSSIFNMIENLSNSIMVPIAGVILAIVMTVYCQLESRQGTKGIAKQPGNHQ